MKQKGFIPLLIAVIVSIVLASVITTGVVLYKQGNLKFTASVLDSVIGEVADNQEQGKTNQEGTSQTEQKLEQFKLEAEKERMEAETEMMRAEAERARRESEKFQTELEQIKREEEQKEINKTLLNLCLTRAEEVWKKQDDHIQSVYLDCITYKEGGVYLFTPEECKDKVDPYKKENDLKQERAKDECFKKYPQK